jgi:toxin-antitoxin system PIN domain toxin
VILLDVNVMVYACRRDAERHAEYHAWLSSQLSGDEPVGVAPESLPSVIRITTHERIWKHPLRTEEAFAFAEAVLDATPVVLVQPTERHWAIFAELCHESRARGNLTMDAWLAALAIENGCTLVTTDRGFARFRGLRWRAPF